MAHFDATPTVGALRYLSNLRIGRVDPKPFKFGIDQEHDDLPQFLVRRVLTGSNLPDVLNGVEPHHPGYKRTEAALQSYLALASRATLCQRLLRPPESISENSIMPNSNSHRLKI